jgi:hypothetical protein
MASGKPRHEFIALQWGMNTKHTLLTRTIPSEIQHRTEMGIGMVMASHELIPVAQHRPAALKMQSHSAAIKPNRLQITHGLLCHSLNQGSKLRLAMQLPNTVDITSPSASLTGVTHRLTPESQQCLQMPSKVNRIDCQLGCRHNRWEKLVKSQSHLSIKKAGPSAGKRMVKRNLGACSS